MPGAPSGLARDRYAGLQMEIRRVQAVTVLGGGEPRTGRCGLSGWSSCGFVRRELGADDWFSRGAGALLQAWPARAQVAVQGDVRCRGEAGTEVSLARTRSGAVGFGESGPQASLVIAQTNEMKRIVMNVKDI